MPEREQSQARVRIMHSRTTFAVRIISSVSLVGSVLIGTAWVRSHFVADGLYAAKVNEEYGLFSSKGKLQVYSMKTTGDEWHSVFHSAFGHVREGPTDITVSPSVSGFGSKGWLGINFNSYDQAGIQVKSIILPYGALFMLLVILPACRWASHRRRRHMGFEVSIGQVKKPPCGEDRARGHN
jgi:uncharacterized iron-regulated membrane protein